jgi:peptidoglycan/LPS O-acetylase OafA/YrhL
MGLLRLFLALCVVVDHLRPFDPRYVLDAGTAVHCFFVISGYYMAMILTEKYSGSPGRYLLNRVLRIWPAYLTVVFTTVAILYVLLRFMGYLEGPLIPLLGMRVTPSPGAQAWLGLTQLSIFGQEWSAFQRIMPGGNLAWDMGMSAAVGVEVWKFNLVPQAWSLGIEEVFYLMAPWYTRLSKWALGAILMVGLAVFALPTTIGLAPERLRSFR